MIEVHAHICPSCGYTESRDINDWWSYCPRGRSGESNCGRGTIMRPVVIRLPKAETTSLLWPWTNPSIERGTGLGTPGVLVATAVQPGAKGALD